MADKLTIVYISYDGMTDPLGQSQVLSYLERFDNTNYEFEIISFEKPRELKKNVRLINNRCEKAGIRWHSVRYTKRPPIISTIVDLFKGWIVFKKIKRTKKIHIVHCRGYLTSILGLWIKRKYGIPFVFDMRGWWADEKIDSGQWSGPHYKLVYDYFKKSEMEFFHESDHIISLTDKGTAEIVDSFGILPHKITTIPTCVDLEKFKRPDGQDRMELRRKLGIHESDIVLVYSGSLGGNYPLDRLFDILGSFLAKVHDSKILIISNQKDILNNYSKFDSFKKSNRMIAVSLEHYDVPRYLTVGDYGLVYYKPGFSNIGRYPTKLGEYWASGLRVISVSNVGDLNELFQKSLKNAGYIIDDTFDFESLSSKDEPSTEELYRLADELMSIKRGVNAYKKVYLEVAS